MSPSKWWQTPAVESSENEPATDGSTGASAPLVHVGEVNRLPVRPVPVTDLVEQASETVLGFALLMGDGIRAVARGVVSPGALPARPDAEPGPLTTSRRVAVGLALDAQRRMLDATEATVQAVTPTVRWLASNPLMTSTTAPARRRLEHAYDRGLEREREARQVAARTSEQTVSLAIPVVLDSVDLEAVIGEVLTKIDLGPVIGDVMTKIDLGPIIDQVLGQLDMAKLVGDVMEELDLTPIVDKVLSDLDLSGLVNDVVGEIQMSSVVMQATGGITEDVMRGVRNRTAGGDALVDRVAAWMKRRPPAELPPEGLPARVADPTPQGEQDEKDEPR